MTTKTKVKKTALLTLLLAIVLGVIASILIMSLIKDSTKTVSVFIAKDTIEEGDPLSKDMFEVKQIHPSGRPETSVNVNDLNLNGTVAAKGMLKGDILREEHLIKIADIGQELPLISSRVKALGDDSLVGAEIPVTSVSGILNGIKKGDRISIVSVYKSEEADEIISETILRDIEVVAVKSDGDSDKGVLAIALTQKQFEELSKARDTGTIHISIQPLGVTVGNSTGKAEKKSNELPTGEKLEEDTEEDLSNEHND